MRRKIQGRLRIQGRAQAAGYRDMTAVKCSSKKSVFRSAIEERVSVVDCFSGGNTRITPNRIAAMHPCAGVNSMVKLLRAHGGCLGIDRR